MTSITAPLLEIAVLVLAIVLLMIEAFAEKIDKRVLAFAAITGLAIISSGQLLVCPSPVAVSRDGFLEFLHSGSAGDLLQAIRAANHHSCADHDDRLRASGAQLPGAAPQTGLGEFVALPLFTCAGLMYLVQRSTSFSFLSLLSW